MQRIRCLCNTLEIPEACANELNVLEHDFQGNPVQFMFNAAVDHIDSFWRQDVLDILTKHKVNGRVTFGNIDRNLGQFWGYDWCAGKLVLLTGRVEWDVD